MSRLAKLIKGECKWKQKSDVFAFGLAGANIFFLISKRIDFKKLFNLFEIHLYVSEFHYICKVNIPRPAMPCVARLNLLTTDSRIGYTIYLQQPFKNYFLTKGL